VETITMIHQDGDEITTFSMTFESINSDELEDYFSRACQALGHCWVKAVEVHGETLTQRAEILAEIANRTVPSYE